ncbi:MAG TPA: hypothetical protein VD789_12335 [Thermomicrobiales bacterium]|nr:hypothetical protein [Thermomicrobiales bacterium]
MMTEPTDNPSDWTLAAERLFGDGIVVRSEATRTFASGETVAHVRIWEPPATVERVTAIRTLHTRVPDGTGIPRPVGEPDSAVLIGGRVYDACSILEGQPLNRHGLFHLPGHGPVEIPLHETADHGDMLIDAARVLAVVHEATRDQPELAATGATSAMQLHTAVQARWLDARKRLGAHAESLQEVRRWLRCGNRVVPIAADRLKAAGEIASTSPVLIHNNIWPAYLMVDDPSTPRSLYGVTGGPRRSLDRRCSTSRSSAYASPAGHRQGSSRSSVPTATTRSCPLRPAGSSRWSRRSTCSISWPGCWISPTWRTMSPTTRRSRSSVGASRCCCALSSSSLTCLLRPSPAPAGQAVALPGQEIRGRRDQREDQ